MERANTIIASNPDVSKYTLKDGESFEMNEDQDAVLTWCDYKEVRTEWSRRIMYRLPSAIYINVLAVKPEEQGKGKGRQLLTRMLEKFSSCGSWDNAILSVKVENERAIHLYKSLGFEFMGDVFKYPRSKNLKLHIMIRPLNTPE